MLTRTLRALRAEQATPQGKARTIPRSPAPARARAIPAPGWLWPRSPPIRVRQTVPDGWLELTLREGRNRQVRRMCAAVGLPCLRLIRARVGDWGLDGLAPGKWREI